MIQNFGGLDEIGDTTNMGQIVKVKVRPGGSVKFPGICAHCTQPAAGQMALKLRDGRRTRIIDIPLCADCHREVGKESGEEERLHRLGRAVVVAAFLVISLILFLLLGGLDPVVVRLLISVTLGALAGSAFLAYFRRARADAALPEKKAILASARMLDFSWRATTFDFKNEQFYEQFVELNQEGLMEA